MFAAVGVGMGGVALWMLRRATFGEVDPLSALFGAASLLVSIVATALALRAWRWQQTNVTDLVERLAVAVNRTEQQARQQLLGGHDRSINVDFKLRRAPAHNPSGADADGRLRDVADYYQRLYPRRLVITGAPGAGKTVLAVELILALLEARTADDAVPVRVSAASWDFTGDVDVESAAATARVEDWLVARLVDSYRLSARSARTLVEAGRVLLVLDGLDEMDATATPGYASRAGQALRWLNAYQHHRTKAALILTCRSGQYEALNEATTWLEDAARVEITPVSRVKTRAFIASRTADPERWQPVLDTIKDPTDPVTVGLSTPWRLTLAVVVYERRDQQGTFQRDPTELISPTLRTPEAIRDHLLALFIPAALQYLHGHRPDPARAHRWLGVLAGYLNQNAVDGRRLGGRSLSSTDIVLHELWPLAGVRRPRVVTVAAIALIWFAAFRIMLTWQPYVLSLQVAAVLVVAIVAATYLMWRAMWPQPKRLDLGRLRTRNGRRRFTLGFVAGLGAGLAIAPNGHYTFGWAFGLGHGFEYAFAPILGLTAGLAIGLAVNTAVEWRDPRSIIRDDLIGGAIGGPTLGLAVELVFVVTVGFIGGLTFGTTLVLAAGLTLGAAGGPPGGAAGLRYIALLLCTRRWNEHWLPWRLGRFLETCYQAGLVRIAGSGYQFRHRELQDYLADHPRPAKAASTARSS